MFFIAGQITVWIVVAVIFGFLIGWLARGRGKSPAKGRRGFK
ncbi:MAG: hypothetical protein QNL12_11490 [Acidimicrobiia bacterium]|nr:hypothetical protein [Acidimicrobiia bacterium]MDX2467929.1 hypothetical protein [Acidimicrobiia bacterium]